MIKKNEIVKLIKKNRNLKNKASTASFGPKGLEEELLTRLGNI